MDSSGRIVGFSGRMFPDSEDGPKYLNSPETEVFNKTRILFGFDKAKHSIRQNNFAILVEGQMDLVLSHQAGFKNTVATSGTAVSEQITEDTSAQLSIISRLTPNIFLAFDGDKAGERALARAALVALSLGMNPKVVVLPEGKDPADFILENGPDAWKNLLKDAKHYILYSLQNIIKNSSAHNAKLQIEQRVFPFIARVPSEIEQIKYLQMIGHELGVGEKAVIQDFELYKNKKVYFENPENKDVENQKPKKTLKQSDRFLTFKKLFPNESLKAENKIKDFSIEEIKINIPEVDIDEAFLVMFEEEYGNLSFEEKEAVALELAEYFIIQSLVEITKEINIKMSKAKIDSNEEEELKMLSLSFKLKKVIDEMQNK